MLVVAKLGLSQLLIPRLISSSAPHLVQGSEACMNPAGSHIESVLDRLFWTSGNIPEDMQESYH